MSISRSSSTILVHVGRLLMAGLFSTAFFSCSSSFQPSSSSPASNASSGAGNQPAGGGNDGGGGGGNSSQTSGQLEAWKALDVSASIAGSSFGGTRVLDIDKDTKDLILRLPMFPISGLDGASLSIPIEKIPGAKFSLEPLSRGGSALVLRIPLRAVIRGDVQLSDPQRLPNGDKIPGIASGELPSTAVEILKAKSIVASVYLSKAFVGVFVTTPFDPYVTLSYPLKSATRTWGTFSTIAAKSGANGGFFISVQIPSDVARIIDDML
jgi:hypothetical protein